jgi:electron transport complex protein RnfC
MNAIVNLANLFKSAKDIFPFHGGVHPPENKAQSTQLPIGQLPIPKKIVLPLRQHVGNIPKIKVKVGDYVLKGQLIAEAEGSVSAAIHASTSGTISAIEDAIIPHPSSLPDRCITITPDGKDQWIKKTPQDWRNAERKSLVDSLRLSGIVGLGGATFPTHIKLRADGKSGVHTLVINAAECEPYITCDDMLMRERADEIVKGITIAQYLLGAENVIIGIEDNKPEAAKAMQAAVIEHAEIQIKIVPTLYPSGDARRLVHLVLNTEIPFDKRSTEVGLQVFNVATVVALYRYFELGEPSISRIVSMTGNVQQPQNFEVIFGTPILHLVKNAGGAKADTSHFIMGGPMMGFNLPSADVPITKAANCIIAASPTLFAPPPPAMPCIRCARCADACPVNLQPQELYWFSKSDNFEKANDYKIFDCIECGACSYVCPSDIPLVQYYRYAKSEIIALDKAKEAADLARERNEFRLARIEREKQERAKKHAERAQAGKAEAAKNQSATRQATDNPTIATSADDTKKEAIAAAIERAKALKAAAQNSASAEQTGNPEKTGAAEQKAEIEKPAPLDDAAKKALIALAIERAKAQKAAAFANGSEPKNVADAAEPVKKEIAEIEARRQAVGLTVEAKSTEVLKLNNTDAAADKKALIAAAITRAKAQKAAADLAKQMQLDSQSESTKE